MKILYLCPDLGIPVLGHKGASVHVREMSGALAGAGHRVILAAQVLNKSPWEKPASVDIPIVQIRPGAATSAAVQGMKQFNDRIGVENSLPGELRRILYNIELEDDLRRRLEADPPDFIYERLSLYATAGVTLAKEFQIPLIVEQNAPLALEQSSYRKTGFEVLAAEAERWTLSRADAVCVVSSELKKHVCTLGIPEKKVQVIPNGVNPALFRPGRRDLELRRKLKLDGAVVLGFIGGLRPWHGLEVLPHLLKTLLPRHKNLRLVIAGEGQLRNTLQQTVRELGLDQQVVFTGALKHQDVPPVLRQFDIGLAPYPALDHAFYFSPLKIFEYMACGVPVVAAEAGQIGEVLKHKKTGMLYRAGDVEGLIEQCEALLSSMKLRQSIGAAAAALVTREYTWSRNAERVIALAGELMQRKQG